MKNTQKNIGFINNQNAFVNMTYGRHGNVSDNGCGFIACYNALKYLEHNINYLDVYNYFNKNKRLNFWGLWGTNPLSVKKYLKKYIGINVKMHVGKVPSRKYSSCIIMTVYKLKKGISAHYVFGYFDKEKFLTYNLNKSYESINDYIKKNDTFGKLFIIYDLDL